MTPSGRAGTVTSPFSTGARAEKQNQPAEEYAMHRVTSASPIEEAASSVACDVPTDFRGIRLILQSNLG